MKSTQANSKRLFSPNSARTMETHIPTYETKFSPRSKSPMGNFYKKFFARI